MRLKSIDLLIHVGAANFSFSQPGVVLWASGPSYPFLFITRFLLLLKEKGYDIVHADPALFLRGTFGQQLSLSFLPASSFYWFGDLAETDATTRKLFLAALLKYEGTAHLGFFSPTAATKVGPRCWSVHLDPVVNKKECYELWTFLLKKKIGSGWAESLGSALLQERQTVGLDLLCLIAEYSRFIGSDLQFFIEEWLPQLIEGEESLFQLASAFFCMSMNDFFYLWDRIASRYNDHFWIVFWSDQFFRAYWFKKSIEDKKDTATIQRLSVRLPFSFIRKDHSNMTSELLRITHNALALLDWHSKNGSSFSLDLFYRQWFTYQLSEEYQGF